MNTIAEFFKEIEKLKTELGFEAGEECFYRGECRCDYDLLPSLLRKKYDEKDDIKVTESSLFYEFSARARSLHSATVDDWDVLFYMRHHGVPTRLIDWTETLGVALYFSMLHRHEDSDPCIWLLNPYKMNEITWEVRDLISPKFLLNWEWDEDYIYLYSDFLEDPDSFEIKDPVAIYPPQKSDRMLAQRGWFTFHGQNTKPLNKISALKGCLRKVVIPQSLREPINEFLGQAGIYDYVMFPDLDGLARYLKTKYEF